MSSHLAAAEARAQARCACDTGSRLASFQSHRRRRHDRRPPYWYPQWFCAISQTMKAQTPRVARPGGGAPTAETELGGRAPFFAPMPRIVAGSLPLTNEPAGLGRRSARGPRTGLEGQAIVWVPCPKRRSAGRLITALATDDPIHGGRGSPGFRSTRKPVTVRCSRRTFG
jgi:hypothetical protein